MASLAEKITRLEIGCGKMPRRGFTSVDIEAKYKPDILGDFRQMQFADLEEILALHVLEHFNRKEGIEILKLWHSWLRASGRLIVETPDLERICQLFANPQQRLWANREYLNISLYGSQEADWAYHRDGYWREKYEQILPSIGFRIEQIWQKHSYIRYGNPPIRYRLPDIRIIAIKI